MICKSKGNYIKNQLNFNGKNPKKFWRIIKDMLSPKMDPTTTARFIKQDTLDYVEYGSEANFLNNYFANIVINLGIPPNNEPFRDLLPVDTRFCFLSDLPTEREIVRLIKDIDVNKSSCIDNINAKFCKEAMLATPDRIRKLIITSLMTGVVPLNWKTGFINVLPKEGDLSNPGNWRPITQTSIFAKLL